MVQAVHTHHTGRDCHTLLYALTILLSAVSLSGHTQVTVSESFNGANSQSPNWRSLGSACLTAGNSQSSPIPGCTTNTAAVGSGVLRITNDQLNQGGAIVSTTPFPSNAGINLTFLSNTWGGNNYHDTGADGLLFFLLDASQITTATPFTLGAKGGGLSYACNYAGVSTGISGGYVGLGVDEYGNFSGAGEGKTLVPNSVRLRGAGNITSSTIPVSYVSSACKNGYYYNSRGQMISILTYQPTATVHMPTAIANNGPITFTLTITKNGLLSLSYIFNHGLSTPILTNQSITASNGPLPANFYFGFAGSTGGGTNFHEISCFKASQITTSETSAGSNTNPNAKIQAGTQSFLASYNLTNATGGLTATALLSDSSGAIVANSGPTWDARCTLTGGSCASTGGSTTAIPPSNRQLITWNGSNGIRFEWASLTPAQQTALTAGDGSVTANRLNFLRGDRSNEQNTNGVGLYRARTSVLGDIMNSSPSWVGAPASPYTSTWKDALYPTTTMPETSYTQFKNANATRMNLVYAGANDGFLHAFRAGGFTSSGIFSTTTYPNDGMEMLGYAPALAVNTIHSATSSALDYSAVMYAHDAFVDATPGTGDLFYNGAWHTWLVAGLGAGGNVGGVVGDATSPTVGSVYALDITSPDTFSETNAAALVKGDWNSNTISCVNSPTCGQNMGSIYGTPIIRRLHDGNWAAIFGNGLNSVAGTAGIFVMTIDSSTGTTSFRYLDTGWGAAQDPTHSNTKNGIAFVTSADLDSDHITDYIYAGDVLGNIWRFDLTSAMPNHWAANSTPLFSASTAILLKPISTAVTVTSVNFTGGLPRVLINFATGRQFPQVLVNSATFSTGTQSMYGIWDWNFAEWNALKSTQYDSMTAPQSITSATLTRQTLTASTFTNSVTGTTGNNGFNGSSIVVCWINTTICHSGNTQFGWVEDLPTNSEQAIYSPTVFNGDFIINTLIPSEPNTISCTTSPPTGNTFVLNIVSGAPGAAFTALTGSSQTAGLGLGATGTAYFLQGLNGKEYMLNQTAGAGLATSPGVTSTLSITMFDTGSASGSGARLSWRELR